MKSPALLTIALAALSFSVIGAKMEKLGPDKTARAEKGWPDGIVTILRHESRVYSVWVNGNENLFFQSSPGQVEELLNAFSKLPIRDHRVFIKKGEREKISFDAAEITYNVKLQIIDGIALGVKRDEGLAETFEPTLTIYVDSSDQARLKSVPVPANIILSSEIADWPQGKATKPERKLWHAAIQFEDGSPAIDFKNDIDTVVTLWTKNEKSGIRIDQVDSDGLIKVALSLRETADLRTGIRWLTLTTIHQGAGEPQTDDPRLPVDNLVPDPSKAKPVTISRKKPANGA